MDCWNATELFLGFIKFLSTTKNPLACIQGCDREAQDKNDMKHTPKLQSNHEAINMN